MRPTTAQERMDLLAEVNQAARDNVMELCRRWYSDASQDLSLDWQEDGTAVLAVNGEPVMSVQVEIAVSAFEYEEASGA